MCFQDVRVYVLKRIFIRREIYTKGSLYSREGPHSYDKFGDPGSQYFCEYKDGGPHIHVNMGTPGPRIWGSPCLLDTGRFECYAAIFIGYRWWLIRPDGVFILSPCVYLVMGFLFLLSFIMAFFFATSFVFISLVLAFVSNPLMLALAFTIKGRYRLVSKQFQCQVKEID